MHCIAEKTSPKTKYQAPNRIANSDKVAGLTLADVQRRGKLILNEAEKLYNYAMDVNSTDDYRTASLSLSKVGESYISGDNLVQDFTLNSNKELKDYDVTLNNFPEKTTYVKNNNKLSIIIPKANIKEDMTGNIKITNAQVKTCPVFYADSGKTEYQDYAVVASAYETAKAETNLNINAHTCSLKIIKTDKETQEKISGVTFNLKYEDGTNIGDYTTVDGTILVENLKPYKVIITETKTNEKYEFDPQKNEVVLEYGKTSEIEITNKRIQGLIEIYKKSSQTVEINGVEVGVPIEGVVYEIYDAKGKLVSTLTTNESGYAVSEPLDKGVYKVKEKTAAEGFIIDTKEYSAEIVKNADIITLNLSNSPIPQEVPEEPTLPRTGM